MMKKFEEPAVEVIEFEDADIVTASNRCPNDCVLVCGNDCNVYF